MNPVLRGSLLLLLTVACAAPEAVAREPLPPIPRPRASRPGNIFLEGDECVVPLPARPAGAWRLLDCQDRLLREVTPIDGLVKLGVLPVGFCRLRPIEGASNLWVSLGVLAPLRAPTPAKSPVALDVAMAWFYPKEKMDAAANLCALAGVNWVRDRLSWPEMEPQRGRFAGTNRYDASALAQSRAGLRVLQVAHSSPPWANPETKRFPVDLRDAFRFWEEMARRWRGQVAAFEPWNEADIPMFGGHTGAEMAALQKASFLGLRAGNPKAIACLNVFAVHNRAQLEDLHDNQAWPYFDTYNLHHYEPFENYPRLYADHRAVSSGRPLWVSECALPVKWSGDEKLQEPTDADLRVQAERVAKTFACSLHEGSVATFYFLLPHYVERQTQFGIVRPDLTPRPAFVALAAVGRLLADARPLGRLRHADENVRAFLFRAKPDGQTRDVLVAWATNGESMLNFPRSPEAMFDHLGRPYASTLAAVRLSPSPIFVLFQAGTARQFELSPPPAPPRFEKGKPSPVVLQALWPSEKTDLKQSAYRLASEKVEEIPVSVHNFSTRPVRGRFQVAAPVGWKVKFEEAVELAPQERKSFVLAVDCREVSGREPGIVRIAGDFKGAGKPVLSLRLLPDR
jgi:hypothetical protein